MKDAQGHGSASRGGPVNDTLKRSKIGLALGAHFSRGPLGKNQPSSEGARTVADLRNRMAGAAGPGHFAALAQGLQNFLNCRAQR